MKQRGRPRITLRLDQRTIDRLNEYAAQAGCDMSSIVRDAIERELREAERRGEYSPRGAEAEQLEGQTALPL